MKKIEKEEGQRFPVYPLSPHKYSLPHYQRLHQSGYFSADEPTLLSYNHPKL